jgi:hypothetical protein
MNSVYTRVDKRIAFIMMTVIVTCAIVLYIIYDYNYGTINTIIGSNNKGQKRIMEMIDSIKTLRHIDTPVDTPQQKDTKTSDNWKVIDNSVFNIDPNLLTDEYYNSPQSVYTIDDEPSYSNI